MIHMQLLVTDWLTVLISKVIMMNKTEDEGDNKWNFQTNTKGKKKEIKNLVYLRYLIIF